MNSPQENSQLRERVENLQNKMEQLETRAEDEGREKLAELRVKELERKLELEVTSQHRYEAMIGRDHKYLIQGENERCVRTRSTNWTYNLNALMPVPIKPTAK